MRLAASLFPSLEVIASMPASGSSRTGLADELDLESGTSAILRGIGNTLQ